jgi:nucleoside-diphosphate-sugar epimerase
MRSYVGDYRLLEEVIGWQPRVNLQDGVKLTVESLK